MPNDGDRRTQTGLDFQQRADGGTSVQRHQAEQSRWGHRLLRETDGNLVMDRISGSGNESKRLLRRDPFDPAIGDEMRRVSLVGDPGVFGRERQGDKSSSNVSCAGVLLRLVGIDRHPSQRGSPRPHSGRLCGHSPTQMRE